MIEVGALSSLLVGIPHIWHIREFGEEDYNLKYDWDIKKATKFMVSSVVLAVLIRKELITYIKILISI